ncbi:MAG: signal recognition particle-docking protein FtsY [Deltaproteobacteria bacterium]|nr:signal recognition particle-docking protein FtsY [Deltaproteobacteria bacterium]
MENNQLLVIILGILLVLGVVVVAVALRARARRKPPVEQPLPPGKAEIPPPAAPEAKTPAPQPAVAPAPTPPPAAAPLTDEARVSKGLGRTKVFFQQTFDKLFTGAKAEAFFGDMEEVLLTADIGIDFTEKIVAALKSSFGMRLPGRDELKARLSDILMQQLPGNLGGSVDAHPRVVLVVGVNGAGKTTTIAKLCQRFQAQGKKVLVGAADTFRAAATEQLRTWVERVGADGVFQKEGSDPSAVAFDSVQAARSRGADVCLIDTAGRLHTKVNLMEELQKMKRVVAKAMPGAPHDVWLVVDGSTGQNALNQAREFNQHLELTGVVVTKLDGSAKGGAVLAIGAELKVPVVFIGVGESPEDLVPFNGKSFVETILEGL